MAKPKIVPISSSWVKVSDGQCFITKIFQPIKVYVNDDAPVGDDEDTAFTIKIGDTFTNNLTEAVWVKASRNDTDIIVKEY